MRGGPWVIPGRITRHQPVMRSQLSKNQAQQLISLTAGSPDDRAPDIACRRGRHSVGPPEKRLIVQRRTITSLSVAVAVLWSVTGFAGVAQAARPTRPLLSIQPASVLEGNGGTTSLSFTVTASVAPTRKGTAVSYVTANGTAIAPGD